MKSMVKKACAGMFAVMMAVSAFSVPSSASSVTGSVHNISCGGSNNITSKGASATTYAGSPMTLSVTLTYSYVQEGQNPPIVKTINSSNANNPVTNILTTAQKPSGNTRSYRCKSTHNAAYYLAGNNYTWSATTGLQYYS